MLLLLLLHGTDKKQAMTTLMMLLMICVKIYLGVIQAASAVFPVWDLRSSSWASAWGLPHWQGEHYRCHPWWWSRWRWWWLKVPWCWTNTVSLKEYERISKNLSTCPSVFVLAIFLLRSESAFSSRCDGVHGEGGGLHHLLLQERDVQLLQGWVTFKFWDVHSVQFCADFYKVWLVLL